MICPKCSKPIVVNKSNLNPQDGGLLVIINCKSCKSEMESFLTPEDFEDSYTSIDE